MTENKCAFCSKGRPERRYLFVSFHRPDVCICGDCIVTYVGGMLTYGGKNRIEWVGKNAPDDGVKQAR